MSSLMQLKQDEFQIMSQLAENLGEVTNDNEDIKLEQLQEQIAAKIAAYVGVFGPKGLIDREIERLDEKKAEIDEYIEKLKEEQARKLGLLCKIAEDEGGYIEIQTEGKPLYLKPFYKQKSHIDLEKVESKFKKYDYKLTLDDTQDDALYQFLNEVNFEFDRKPKALLADLPEGHEAISKELTPSIKIVKTKPRQVQKEAA